MSTSLLRRGVDLHKVQRVLGHTKITTTLRYLHLADGDLADAIDSAFPCRTDAGPSAGVQHDASS